MAIVERSTSRPALRAAAARLCPDLIVTSAQLLGDEDVRRFSPGAKLIVITGDRDAAADDDCASGVDARLDEEDLVRGLRPIVHTLAAHAR